MSDDPRRPALQGGWHVLTQNGPRGPLSDEGLSALIRQDELRPTDLIWGPGFLRWRPAGEVAGLFAPPPPSNQSGHEATIPHTSTAKAESPSAPEPSSERGTQPLLSEPDRDDDAKPAIHIRSRWARHSYIARHWRGDLSLGVSYWVNGFLGNLLFVAIAVAATAALGSNSNIAIALIATALLWALVFCITAWQAVGIWRAANQHPLRGGKVFWAAAAKLFVIIGAIRGVVDFGNVGVPQISEFVKIIAGDPAFAQHQIRILRDGTELEYAGGITFGVADEIRKFLDAAPQIKVVHLNSPGGRLGGARELHNLIRERGLTTYVSSRCLSACTIAFIGGKQRWISPAAKLGFHKESFPGTKPEDLAAEMLIDKKMLLDAGVSPEFVEHAYATPSESMWYPATDELLRAHVITGIADPSQFAISGLGIVPMAAEIEAELVKTRVYAILKKTDPDVFAEIRDDWLSGIRNGATRAELNVRTRNRLSPILKKYMPHASDEAVVEIISVVIDEIDAISARDPDVCYDFLTKPEPLVQTDISRYVTPEIAQRELSGYALAIESASTAPQPAPTEKEADPILRAVFLSLTKQYGNNIFQLANPAAATVDHRTMCAMTVAIYRKVLSLPPKQRGVALRYMLSQS